MDQPHPIPAASDFSPAARRAADRAARVAHTTGSPLALVHVLPGGGLQELPAWLGGGSAVEQQLHADAAQQLRQLADQLQRTRHAPVRTVHASGAPADEIVQAADGPDAALLVLGSRGANFLIDFYRRRARAEAARRLHELAAAACLKPGDPWLRIVEQEQDCDLIVLGKHGRSASEELLLGSVTQLVLAEGSADVLVSTRTERDHPTPA